MRLVYLGTPEAAVPPLQALVAAGHIIELVVSQPDRKRGRGGALVPSPVKQAALDLGLIVTDDPNDVLATTAELGVVVAFGQLIKPIHLAAMPYVNIHFSLLPRWRGAAPVERALLAGDAETGCCLMGLEAGLDTGPVYRRVVTPIEPQESAATLRARLVGIGTEMLVDALADGFTSLGNATPQVGEPTHAAKLRPEEFQIHWERSAQQIHNVIRVGNAWTLFRRKRVKVLVAKPADHQPNEDPLAAGQIASNVVGCGAGAIELVVVQPEGKAAMPVHAWLNGVRPTSSDRLGT